MSRWFVGAVIFRKDRGVLEFLVMASKSIDPKFSSMPVQTKFVGGTEKAPDKDVIETLRREIFEETDLVLRAGHSPLIIDTTNLPGHFKNFYLIPFESLEGTMRTKEKTMEGDRMEPPRWVEFETAHKVLYMTHRSALTKAHNKLAPTVA